MAFTDDIQGQNTQLYPVVVIDGVYYSTNNVSIDGNYCKPILMNIPSIKESIDIESRKFKISNVSLDFNNFSFEGERFSDQLSQSSLINKEAIIYFKSPSELKELFKGTIRRISHDDEKVRVDLEDLTEKEAHKDLPSEILPDTEGILEKYRNKPKPMVYGNVDKSPVVLGLNNNIIIDYKEIRGLNYDETDFAGDPISPLLIELDNRYLGVLPQISKNLGTVDIEDVVEADTTELEEQDTTIPTEGSTQWQEAFNELHFSSNIMITKGVLQCKGSFKPRAVEITERPDYGGDEQLLTDNEVEQLSDGIYTDQSPVDLQASYTYNGGNFHSDYSAFRIRMFRMKIFTDLSLSDSLIGSDTASSRVRKIALNGYLLPIPQLQIGNYQVIHFLPVTSGMSQGILEGNVYNFYLSPEDSDDGVGFDLRGLFRFGDDNWGNYDSNYVAPTDYDIDVKCTRSINLEESDDDGFTMGHFAPAIYMYDICGAGNQGNNGTYLIDFRVHSRWEANTAVQESLDVYHQLDLEGNFNEIDFSAIADIDKAFNKTFYVNVYGRVNNQVAHPNLEITDLYDYSASQLVDFVINNDLYDLLNSNLQSAIDVFQAQGILTQANSIGIRNFINQNDYYVPQLNIIENPIDIIYDILRSELGLTAQQIDTESYQEAWDAHSDWKFAFTLNKKMNSKKLIEDIAKSTKCFPKFRNDGTFGFNTIKDSYSTSDYDDAHPIKQSDVISYSFKKTKPEQIYRQVDVQYNMDYAQDSLLSRTDMKDNGASDFYSIESPDDAYLEFESPYIRIKETAENLRDFLAAQYKNDHLIFSLKLPLQYIDLEIGELVKFEELFQGLKAYGIDYRVIDGVSDTEFYPLFMITSITKNLDSVSIECMQLHHLSDEQRDSAWDNISFPDSEPFIVEPYLFAPDVVTTEFQETDDSIETNNLYIDLGTQGIPRLTNPNDTFNFLDYDGSDGESSIFMLNEYIQIKNYTDSIIVKLAAFISSFGGFQGIQLAGLNETGGFTFFPDQMIEYEKLRKFGKPEGWQEGDPLPTLEITRVIPASQTVQSRNGKGIKITEIIENNELYFDNKYDLKDLLEMQ
jgi:hypothetical protein